MAESRGLIVVYLPAYLAELYTFNGLRINDKRKSWPSRNYTVQSNNYNAKIVISEVTHFLYCSVMSLGGKVNARQMLKSDIESIFTKMIYEIFWSLETIQRIFKIIKIECFYPPRILDEHWCIYSWQQIPPRENWFQYVRQVYIVYTTAINFPCIITLSLSKCIHRFMGFNVYNIPARKKQSYPHRMRHHLKFTYAFFFHSLCNLPFFTK